MSLQSVCESKSNSLCLSVSLWPIDQMLFGQNRKTFGHISICVYVNVDVLTLVIHESLIMRKCFALRKMFQFEVIRLDFGCYQWKPLVRHNDLRKSTRDLYQRVRPNIYLNYTAKSPFSNCPIPIHFELTIRIHSLKSEMLLPLKRTNPRKNSSTFLVPK